MNQKSNKTIISVLLIALAFIIPPNMFAQVIMSRQPKKTVNQSFINGHGYVDLGLPSGTKWATCNVGANRPEEYGEYFAWGEICSKTSYVSNSSITYAKALSNLHKDGVVYSNGVLSDSYDASTANWGVNWRMPTRNDIDELLNKCKWVWTSIHGINGYKVTGPNGKSIFIPSAGMRVGLKNDLGGNYGYYWSSTANDDGFTSYYITLSIGSRKNGWFGRTCGFSIRPVVESIVQVNQLAHQPNKYCAGKNTDVSSSINPSGYINGHAYVDLGLPSRLKWATCNVGAESQEKYGDYFAWGETSMKENYKENNSFTRNKTISTMQTLRIINESGILNESYDAASVNWGSSWRLPTEKEFEELKVKCKWQWIEMGGEYGYKITGPNKKSIFLPAAGFAIHNFIRLNKECGYYWSSSVEEENNAAYMIGFDAIGSPNVSWNLRHQGCPVRPVSF